VPGKVKNPTVPQLEHNECSALPGCTQATASRDGGVATYRGLVTGVTTCRENIGGIEVVDAGYADRLICALVELLEARRDFKIKLSQRGKDRSQENKDALKVAEKRRHKAVKACHLLVQEGTGIIPAPS